jgi:deoxyguanosine kinase
LVLAGRVILSPCAPILAEHGGGCNAAGHPASIYIAGLSCYNLPFMDEIKYIVIEGLVKSGKSRLAAQLAEKFQAKLLSDNQTNPFLQELYENYSKDDHSLTLKTQLIFLINRYMQQQQLKQKDLFQKMTVADYLFYRDGIYAHTILNEDDLDIYKKLYHIFAEKISVPHMVVYLQTSFTEMMARINRDGDEAARRMPQVYWHEIFEAYNRYFFNYKLSPLLVVNVEKTDLANPKDLDNLIKEMNTHKKGIKYYAPA